MGLINRLANRAPELPAAGSGGKEPTDPYSRRSRIVDGVKGLLTGGSEVIKNLPPSILTPRVTNVGSWQEWWETISADLSDKTPAALFAQQPHLRTVVSFRARNMAQLGLHVFERVDENDRRRDRKSVVARTLASPDGVMTTYELIFATVGDLDLYDRAHWLVVPNADRPSGWMIRRIPPAWITPEEQTAFEVTKWRVTYGRDSVLVDASDVLSFTGYSPTDPRRGSSTVEALKGTLQEQIEAALYRSQIWKRGGRVSAVIERPSEAPDWSDAAREAFREDWYAKYTGRGSRAGGTPILEDGMTLRRIDFNAQEQQFVEAAKLSLVTVASAYHVNPTMIGQNEGATYSNVREFRKMLYGDTLGPLSEQLQQRINTFLIPMMGEDPERLYTEFNIEEKLQGNFEEQSDAMSKSTGAPWMTRNEARALRNLPAIEGGDELVTPLNVLIGGQSSPQDGVTGGRGGSGRQALPEPSEARSGASGRTADELLKLINAASALIRSGFAPDAALTAVGLDPIEHLGLLPVTIQKPEAAANPDEDLEDALKVVAEVALKKASGKAPDPQGVKVTLSPTYREQAFRVLAKFFERQGQVIRSHVGANRDWWDAGRWEGELQKDLAGLYVLTATQAGREALAELGIDPEDYDEPRTHAFLLEAARISSEEMNATTREQVEMAIAKAEAEDRPKLAAVSETFEQAMDQRAQQAAAAVIAFATGFGVTEAARQQVGDSATKTWLVNSSNPRPQHAAMHGETVGINEVFSNGLEWPGAFGPPEQVAGCECSVAINIP